MENKLDKFILEGEEILNNILGGRENDIYEITEEERNLNKLENKNYTNIYAAIENIPDMFVETRRGIKTSVEKYIETLSAIQAIENEKFYKAGFSDAIKLVVKCLSQNTSNKKEL